MQHASEDTIIQPASKKVLKQGLYLSNDKGPTKHASQQQPAASASNAATAQAAAQAPQQAGAFVGTAAGALRVAVKPSVLPRISADDVLGLAAGKSGMAGLGWPRTGQPPAGLQQQQQQLQLPHLQLKPPGDRTGSSSPSNITAPMFQHAFQPREVHTGRTTATAQGVQAGNAKGAAAGTRLDNQQLTPRLLGAQLQPLRQLQPPAVAGLNSQSPGGRPTSSSSTIHSQPLQQQQQQPQSQRHKHQPSRDPYSDPEVQERTAVWTKLMESIRRSSEGAEFVYLRHAWPQQLPFNPFDLEVCSHAQAVKSGSHFTMSCSGVTMYFADGSWPEFVPLDKWQREFKQHQKLMQIPLFRHHRRWKAFSVWRRAVRALKTTSSAEKLQKGLLMLNPLLQKAVYSVRAACLEVEAQQLSCLQPGQPMTLTEFSEQHAVRLQQAQEHLSRAYDAAVSTAKAASQAAMEALQLELVCGSQALQGQDATASNARRSSVGDLEEAAASRRQAAATATTAAARIPAQGATGTAAPTVQLLSDSFAMQAAQRTEKRKLCSFICLLDYMLGNSIRSLVVKSMQHMLQCFLGQGAGSKLPVQLPNQLGIAAEQSLTSTELSLASVAAAPGAASSPTGVATAASNCRKLLVLQLEVLLDQTHDQLLLEPRALEFGEQLAAWLRSVDRVVRSTPRLLCHAQLQASLELRADAPNTGYRSGEAVACHMLGEDFEHLEQALDATLNHALDAVHHYAAGFEVFRDMVVVNRAFSSQQVQEAVSSKQIELQGLRDLLLAYKQQLADVQNIPADVPVRVLKVNLSRLVAALVPSPQRCLSDLHELLPKLAAAAYTTFIARVRDYKERLSCQPGSAEEFVAHAALIAEVEAQRPAMDKEFDLVVGYYDMLHEFDIKAPEEEVAAAACLDGDYGSLRDSAWAAESAQEREAEVFREQLEQQAAAVAKEVSRLRQLAEQDMFLADNQDVAAMVEASRILQEQVAAQKAIADRLSQLSVQCGGGSLALEELEKLSEDVQLKHTLWSVQQEWADATAQWLQAPMFELNVADLQEQVDQYSRTVHRLERGLPPNGLVPRLRDGINHWQEILGPVGHLRNPLLRERHWQAIADMLGQQVDRAPGATTSIAELLDLQLLDHKEQIASLSNEAVQVAALEDLLAQVAEKWRSVEFKVTRFKDIKDSFILGEVDDVLQVLEDSKITLSMIQASKYVGGIKSEVDRMDRQLQTFAATLDVWLRVQKGWVALEAVFAAPDIQRQVPAEAAAFAQVDKAFKDIMRCTHDRPNALQCGTMPVWMDALTKCAETLEAVKKGLEDYLESKRVAFPRLYFLSNEELLDILRQAKIPQAVQPHLPKCFEGMRALEFAQPLQSAPSISTTESSAGAPVSATTSGPGGNTEVLPGLANDILAMLSPEGERVAFGRVLKARGLVESWLSTLEAHMRLTLKALTKKAIKEYSKQNRPAWALSQPAQLVVLASNIHWCQDVEAALQGVGISKQVQQLHTQCVMQLEDLTELVRSPLSELERKAAVALISADVHNRDVVAGLMAHHAASVNDFTWQMQLRFEFDPDADSVLVRQVNARFSYGYEYLGTCPRIIVTPMTDRCFLTLTGALAFKLGGAPSGPAGTGKTESVKDLAKSLGMQCVVFNCSENLDHMFMAKFFRGISQCGAWACLDEFNRMELEVLSVVAQQLHALQSALRAGSEKLFLEGRELPLLPTCGVFVTQNPGYAGRTELPDNLQVLFRPIAMTVPDYELIAEVMLFTEGFSQASWLAGKMVFLYKLASQQLSQQGHYDFGLRALKAVLVMAGSLKRAAPHEPEAMVAIRALRDANSPKLLLEDVVLFEAIISDLFPELQPPAQDQQVLSAALAAVCRDRGLQPEPAFLAKAMQLHDTLGVRFGVMLLGFAGGGKTACYETLLGAQSALLQTAPGHGHNAATMPDQSSQACERGSVHTHVLNPKAISLLELYGSYNPVTTEWMDGLASRIARATVLDTSTDMHWVVFDGPVDSAWIESMNSALDDNRMLCLPNGERIKLNESRLRFMFEVEDLSAASPATVSRCGMVYMPADVISWRPRVKSWLDKLMAQHVAEGTSAAAEVSEQALPAADPSQVASPSSPNQGLADAGATFSVASGVSMTCPEHMQKLRDFIWAMFEQFVDPLLEWVVSKGTVLLPQAPTALTAAVTAIFETHAEGYARMSMPVFDPSLSEAQQVLLQYLFAYATVWGIGGSLSSNCWDAWDKVVRDQFDGTANYPGGSGSVFDFYVDTSGSTACFARWESLVPTFNYKPAMDHHAIMVPTVDTCRYGSLLQACLAAGKPVLLVGGSGVGKSAIIKECVDDLRAQLGGKLDSAVLNCSAHTTSASAQQLLEANLVKRGHRLGPPAGRRMVVFVDDLHLPEKQQYGAQPALEMLRLLLDKHGMYQRKTLAWRAVIDTVLVAAAGVSSGSQQGLSQRLTHHMVALAVPAASETVMRSICSAVLGGFLQSNFTPDVHSKMLRPLVESCVEVYAAVSSTLLPTPSHIHYSFNFRDMSRVLQGMLSIAPASCGGNIPAALARLWVHEVQRVFGDRLVCEDDRCWLRQLQQELLVTKFGWEPASSAQRPGTAANGAGIAGISSSTVLLAGTHGLLSQQAAPTSLFGTGVDGQACLASDAIFDGPEQVLFGDFAKLGLARHERVYEQLPVIDKLAALLERYQEEYKMAGGKSASAAAAAAAAASGAHRRSSASSGPAVPVDSSSKGAQGSNRSRGSQVQLVFYQDAILHVVRLARILRQPRGSALLVGVGGSGKQSLATFAAFIADCEVLTVSRGGGGLQRFRDEVKKLYKVAGVEGRHVVFLLRDSDIVDEAMLADINGLLNAGEITGLFTTEEQVVLLDQLRPWLATQPELRPGRAAAWEAFINRARHHMHIIFATSPVGEAFRARCRQFPSLVNCMTVDWFSAWPAEALLGVGVRFVEELNIEQALVPGAVQGSKTTGAASPGALSAAEPQAGITAPPAVTASAGQKASSSSNSMVTRVVQLCVEIHQAVELAADRMHQEMQRRCYITPRSYLDLLQQYAHLLTRARTELGDNRRRLLEGITKLSETSAMLDSMQAQLNELQPLLAEKTAATSALLQQIREEQAEAQSVAAVVAAEEAEVAAKAAACKALKDEAEADLAAVLPAFEAAVAALGSLNKADIVEMKTFIKPPALVQLTMEGVCILLQEKTDWDSAKRVLGDATFINRLIEYDKDKITEKIRRELKRVTADPAFTPDQVSQQSKAAMSMCLWVRAMDTYATVYRIIEPKRQILAAAQAALDASNAALAEKQQQLKAISDKVAALQQQLADTQKQLAALQFQIELCNKRLNRAGKLTSVLGDEVSRWGSSAAELSSRLECLVGDALLAAAVVNYLGPFTGVYRSELVSSWCARCHELAIPAGSSFSLSATLSTPVELLEWTSQGLPTDLVSVENALIATQGIRWPLIIDPQEQCSRWVQQHEASRGLVVVRASQPNLLRLVEGAVRLGTPLLLDDLPEETLPPGLDDVLLWQPGSQPTGGGTTTVRVGDVDVEFDPAFKLYLVTRLDNPTYLPEANILVNLVNFTITQEGLEEQLLAELVRAERPELEESRDNLITSIGMDKRQLQQLECKILRLLRETTGNLLDDEMLLSTLNTAKETSAVIQSRVREAELTEIQINEARSAYRLAPISAARLWFVIADLAALDPMYTTSLAAFTAMFRHCIASAPAAATLQDRLAALVAYVCSYVHNMVCRGLMQQHKLAFSFMMATAEPRSRAEVGHDEWQFFLNGGRGVSFTVDLNAGAATAGSMSGQSSGVKGRSSGSNSSSGQASSSSPALGCLVKPPWCKPDMWDGLRRAEAALSVQLQGLCQAVAGNTVNNSIKNSSSSGSKASSGPQGPAVCGWQQLLEHGTVQDFMGSAEGATACLLDRLVAASGIGQQQHLAGEQAGSTKLSIQSARELQGSLTSFQRLILVKACKEELLATAMHSYVSSSLGPSFADPPGARLADVFADSSAASPITLIMTQGADAIAELAAFAAERGRAVGRGLQLLSLGKGQGPVAEAMVRVAARNGDWVCLQNCHLAKSWMPQLARLVEQIQAAAAVAEPAATAAAAAMAGPAAAGVQAGLDPSAGGQSEQQQLHPDFRLWLTTAPVDYFPPSVLHKGLRLAMEPPKGLKPTVLKVYSSLPPGFLSKCDSCGRARQWQRLVFVGALLHGLLVERRRFGPLGWNVPYGFSDGDLSCALSSTLAVVQDLNQDLLLPCQQKLAAQQLQLPLAVESSSSTRGRCSSSGGLIGGSSSSSAAVGGGSSSSNTGWDALLCIVGQINYGGRVTDPDDRRLLSVIMQQYLSPSVLGEGLQPEREGPPLLQLPSPYGSDIASCLAHIQGLPLSDNPDLFGLHPNAAIASNQQEAEQLLDAVLRMQPCSRTGALRASTAGAARRASTEAAGSRCRSASAAGGVSANSQSQTGSTAPIGAAAAAPRTAPPGVAAMAPAAAAVPHEVLMLGLIRQLLDQLPLPLSRGDASVLHDPFALLPGGRMNPLGVVLLQEMDRYNKLLGCVHQSLLALQSACAGFSVLGAEGEASLAALTNHQVPASWVVHAYPSGKPLGSWMADLVKRVAFMRQWLTTGPPAAFWLPGFYYPEAFLIAVLQRHALQARGLAIDRLSFAHHVLDAAPGPSSIAGPPSVGVYIYGLLLEAARWDAAAGCLADAALGEMHSPLPVIHLVPHEVASGSASEAAALAHGSVEETCSQGSVQCPVYKTPARAGVLNSTGQSTNFLMHMQLPIPQGTNPQKWLMCGVAALCSLDA